VVVGAGWLVLGLAMALWTFVGRWVVLLFRPGGPDEPAALPPESIVRLEWPDGTAPEEETVLELLERGATVAAPEQALSASARNAVMKIANLFTRKQMPVAI
jgi:hypothetical protein